ncbi:MAG: hypothetical protein DRJ47_05345 [Thermoprotei archaeon]|nr:MAG: hypothetical protein DRJ47_05345 [Thermoprotei archaeon]
MKLSLKVKNLMSRKVVFVEVPGSRRQALELMLKTGHIGIPAVKKGSMKLVGMINPEDLINKSEEEDLAFIVNRDYPTVKPDDSLRNVVEIMLDKDYRKIPVVDEDRQLVGIISVYDVLAKVVSRISIPDIIEEYVHGRVPTAWEETPLRVAFMVMKHFKSSVLIALDSRCNITGIITLDDLMKEAEVIIREMKSSLTAPSEGMAWSWDPITIVYVTRSVLFFPETLKLKDIMTKNIVTVNEYASVSHCAKLMVEKDIDQLPVVDLNGELKGIIYDIDLLKAITKYLK